MGEAAVLRALLLWAHLAGVVVWFGAIAYFLVVLRPAVAASGIERRQWYALLRQVKRRLRRVVGGSLALIVITGLLLANQRALLTLDLSSAGPYGAVFGWKMLVVLALIVIYLTALPLLERVQAPKRRGRLFLVVHGAALSLGAIAAFLGLLLHG